MKILFFPLIMFVSIGCNNADTNKQTQFPKADTVISTPNVPVQLSPKADSIEQVNAAAIKLDGDEIQKASISKTDSSVQLTANMKVDHRIFGYEKPDINSRKMILISIFTNDVKDNPFKLPYGAYYQTSDMETMELKFVGNDGGFVKVNVLNNKVFEGTVFVEKKMVAFDD